MTLVEFVLASIVQGASRPEPALIAAAAFAITTLLTVVQLKDHYPATSIADAS